jgi:uncharacterized membrane protein YjjP (DUF1212 family)
MGIHTTNQKAYHTMTRLIAIATPAVAFTAASVVTENVAKIGFAVLAACVASIVRFLLDRKLKAQSNADLIAKAVAEALKQANQ